MPDPTEPAPLFAVGARVRVKPGTPSDYPDIPMGGWTGIVREAGRRVPRTYLVAFDMRTCVQVNAVYRKRCDRDGYSATEYNFREEDLVPDTGELSVIEQPTQIESRSQRGSSGDWVDDSIRGHLGLTPDDPIRGQGGHSWTTFQEHFYMVTEARTQAVLGAMYPALADWIEHHGTIEIGRVGEGSVVRLRSGTRVAFEDAQPRSLADALNALETAFACDMKQLAAPVVFDRAWLTPTVEALAQQIDDSGDFTTMPILADALQDAGCDHAEVLNHCRGPAAHKHDCWVIGVILGKP